MRGRKITVYIDPERLEEVAAVEQLRAGGWEVVVWTKLKFRDEHGVPVWMLAHPEEDE